MAATSQDISATVFVFFGFPIAHEDDAARAIHTSLEIIKSLSPLNHKLGLSRDLALQVRIGIATGLVVVGDVNTEGVTEHDAVVGEAANLAARLQALASPNSIVVSGLTRQLAAERFEYHDLGARPVKGFDRRDSFVPSRWRAVSCFEATARGVTPFVGREDECDLLIQTWKVSATGEGQVVLLSGEAGIGKSQLCRWSCSNGLRATTSIYNCNVPHITRTVRSTRLLSAWKRSYF